MTWETPEFDGGSPITQYAIVIREEGKKKLVKAGQTDGNTFSFTISENLKKGHSYSVQVYSENAVGASKQPAELPQCVTVPDKEKPQEEISEKGIETDVVDGQMKARVDEEKKETVKTESEELVVDETVEVTDATKTETVPAKTLPAGPKSLAVTSIDYSHISLSWDKPDDDGGSPIKTYIVVMRDSDKSKYKKVGQVTGDVTDITINKIKEGRDYFLRVYSENEIGISKDGVELDSAIHIPRKKEPEGVNTEQDQVNNKEPKINEEEVKSQTDEKQRVMSKHLQDIPISFIYVSPLLEEFC